MRFIESLHASDEPDDEEPEEEAPAEEEEEASEEEEEEEEEEEDEEDLVDPLDTLREKCKEAHCMNFQGKLDTCNDRVSSRSSTAEQCVEELMDLFHCMDHCASKTLFSKLK